MPWPAIAAIAGKIIGGLGASGAAGAGVGASGASAGGIGGMLNGSSLMGMMGGNSGAGGGKSGGMMQNMMQNAPHKKMEQAGQAFQSGLVNMLSAQDGASITPELLNYMSKIQGAQNTVPDLGADNSGMVPQGSLDPSQSASSVMMDQMKMNQASMPSIDNPQASGTSIEAPNQAQGSITPENPNDMKTQLPGQNQGPAGKSAASQIGSLMGMMGKGNYTTNDQGVTQVTETSDIMGNALKKVDPKNPASLVTAGVALVGGKVKQMSEMRRANREEEQLRSDFQRAQQASSVYADPNSVYYSAKDGAPIKGYSNGGKSLSSMMKC